MKVSPSILSAPITALEQTLRQLEAAQADYIHFDIEDGSFVPVINMGTKIIEDLRPLTQLPFDVHLMVHEPEWLIPKLAACGADQIAVHYEACPYPRRTLSIIKQHGLKAGLAFNPKTPIPPLDYFSSCLDYVLVLTTEPEEGECEFLPPVLEKVRRGKPCNDGRLMWFADGGIAPENIGLVSQAGVDAVVSGRGVFARGDVGENIARLKSVWSPSNQ